MKIHVLAAVLALAVTPALAQTDTSMQPPSAQDMPMQKPMAHKTMMKKHHARASQATMQGRCKHMVKTVDTQKAQPCT